MKIRHPWLTRILAFTAMCLMRLLFATCRRQYIMAAPNLNPYEDTGDQRNLYCVWHDQILMVVFTGRAKNLCGLVSRHQDGSYLSDAMRMVGITPIRGSHNHGGAEAMREMLDKARDYHICITPDGPRGPRREIKQGIIYLASRSGRPIIPVTVTCKSSWKIQGNWTDMLVPKPFTTIYGWCGEPLAIPPDISRDGIDRWVQELTDRMNRLEARAERLRHVPATPVAEDEPEPSDSRAA